MMALAVDLAVTRGDRSIEADFDVAADETVAILGPNGAGKTTIVEGVAGLVPETRGELSLDGDRIDGLAPDRRPIGIAFQDGVLFPHLSALENVAFPGRARGARPRAARAHARDVLARVAPAVNPGAKPAELSGGARQRVALARALAGDPRVLILDEPLSSVDVSARAELRTLLRRTLDAFDGPRLLVTHDPIEAMTLADRIVVLEDGRITQIGTPGEIRAAPRTRYAADLVGLNLFRGTLVPIAGGAGELRTPDGPITVAWPGDVRPAPVDDVLATLAPADVALHAERPEGSPRNVVRGVVEEVAILGDRARVRLHGAPALVAEITTGSAERMGIVAGTEVWASFKAVELRLMVEPIAADTL
jgi:molybdate transport system ATP-binding protein